LDREQNVRDQPLTSRHANLSFWPKGQFHWFDLKYIIARKIRKVNDIRLIQNRPFGRFC
jgi:hypothetical protein